MNINRPAAGLGNGGRDGGGETTSPGSACCEGASCEGGVLPARPWV